MRSATSVQSKTGTNRARKTKQFDDDDDDRNGYDSDFSLKSTTTANKSKPIRRRSSSNESKQSARSDSPVAKNTNGRKPAANKSYSSMSRSRSYSTRSRSVSRTPSPSRSSSEYKSKTTTAKTNLNTTKTVATKTNKVNNSFTRGGNKLEISKNSSHSYPAKLNKKPLSKPSTKQSSRNGNLSYRPPEQLNKLAVRVMSAQRQKNNDLQNRIGELTSQIEALKEENRTLKRVHQREEAALRKLESQDSDVSRLIRNHMEEANALKEIIKNVKGENTRLNKVLIDKDEDIRQLKKKLEEFKKILSDKKLLDSAELNRRLEQCEKELDSFKLKCENLEKKNEMSEKNHKHEMGVEMAHHRETQRALHKAKEENRELRVRLEEKERALDVANIYSQRVNRDLSSQAQWKSSTQSLNTVGDSPREKRKEDKKRKDLKPPKPIKEDHHDSATTTSSSRNNQLLDDELELERQKQDLAQKKQELELKLRQEEEAAEERRRRQEEAARRQRESELAEKKRREEADAAARRQKSDEEEKRRREEKERLEEEDRKKRYISEQTIRRVAEGGDDRSTDTKDQLLAKLSLSSSTSNANSPNPKSSVSSADLPPRPSRSSNEIVDSLHQGKPVPTAANPKNELLSKLFGNPNGPESQSNRADNLINSSNSGVKLSQFPWETNGKQPESDFFSAKPPNGSLNRPKLQNSKLLVSANNHSGFEDVEELTL